METKDVLKEFAARGLRAATLPELLAFGQAYPKNEEIRTIVALGSVWRQNQYACLIEDWERGLYVGGGAGFKWGAHCQFVAVASE